MKAGVLVALTAVAAAFSACGGSGDDVVTIAGTSPKEKIEAANLDGIHSGQVSASVFVSRKNEREAIGLRFTAFFNGLNEATLPKVQIAASSQSLIHGRNVDFNGSLFLLPDEAVLVYGHAYKEQPYKPDKDTFEALKSKLEEAQEEGGDGDVTTCLEAARGVELDALLRNPKSEGRAEGPDGTDVFKLTAEIDIPSLAETFIQLADDPHCGAQMRALGLPSASELKAAETALAGRLENAQATLALDKQGVLREVRARLEVKSSGEPEYLEVTWALSNVNHQTPIYGSDRRRPFDALLRKFGTDTETALQVAPRAMVLGFLRAVSAGMTGRLP